MKKEELFKGLKAKYTTDEAKKAIDAVLAKYGSTCKIHFGKTNAEITDSYKVNDKDSRHLICEIIARAGVTKRNFEDLAAEWEVHNVAYKTNIGKDHAKDVNLDYTGDPRAAVKTATKIFDKLNIE